MDYCYVTDIPWVDMNKNILTPGRQPAIENVLMPLKSDLGETMSSIGVIYRNVGERSLIEAEMAQLHHQSPPQQRWKLTKASKWEHTAQPAGNSTGWPVSLPHSSMGLNFFQADGLVSTCRKFSLSENIPQQSLWLYMWSREGSIINLVNLRTSWSFWLISWA